MNFRQKLGYTILGAGLMLIGTLTNYLTGHETAKDAEFGVIKCEAIVIGRYGDDEGSIFLYTDADAARISLESGNQHIRISCKDDRKLPSCEIRMEGGLDGENRLEIKSGENDPRLDYSHGVFVSRNSIFPQVSMLVNGFGGGNFISRDEDDIVVFLSPSK